MDYTETSDDSAPALQPLLLQALNQMADGVMLTDGNGRIAWVNEAFCRFSGYISDELVGRTPSILKSGEQGSPFYAHLWQTIRLGRVWQGKVIDRRKDGTLYTVEECITPLRGADGAIEHFVAVQHDATEQVRLFEREHFLARHDTLTGLPNRALLHETAHQAVATASRTQDMVTFIYLDLDGFKKVNDQFGHRVGDQLLSAVADRLRRTVRESDIIARVGGDEFVAVASSLASRAAAEALARKLIEACAAPFQVRGQRFQVGASAGVAMFPHDGTDIETLIDNADRAMYYAKLQGGNRHQCYAPSFEAGRPAER
jgi:diguanylate cyclase (GGDEF)-like protein/PAS domain S-box-containing protein